LVKHDDDEEEMRKQLPSFQSEPPPDGEPNTGKTAVGEAAYEMLARTMSFDSSKMEEQKTTKPPPPAPSSAPHADLAPVIPTPPLFPVIEEPKAEASAPPRSTAPEAPAAAPEPSVDAEPGSPLVKAPRRGRGLAVLVVAALVIAAVVYFMPR
jgi:hypothetical protein